MARYAQKWQSTWRDRRRENITNDAPVTQKDASRSSPLPRKEHTEGDAMAAAPLRFREEGGRVAVRVHDQIAVVDSKSPVGRVGAAEDLDAAADVLRGERLEADGVRVVPELRGRLA